MSTMNISLPESLKIFVEKKVQSGIYSTNSEYVKELIRKDQDREQLRNLLLDGATSKPASRSVDGQYFQNLRDKVQARKRS